MEFEGAECSAEVVLDLDILQQQASPLQRQHISAIA